MTATLEFTVPDGFADEAPNLKAAATPEYACEVCGKELIYGGRGRKPTRCDEHKRNAGKTTGGNGGTSKGQVKLIEESLTQCYLMVGLGLSAVPKCALDGQLVASNAAMMAHSWAQMAETDPKLRKALMKLISAAGWGTVIAAHLPVVLGIMGNHNMLPAAVTGAVAA